MNCPLKEAACRQGRCPSYVQGRRMLAGPYPIVGGPHDGVDQPATTRRQQRDQIRSRSRRVAPHHAAVPCWPTVDETEAIARGRPGHRTSYSLLVEIWLSSALQGRSIPLLPEGSSLQEQTG